MDIFSLYTVCNNPTNAKIILGSKPFYELN